MAAASVWEHLMASAWVAAVTWACRLIVLMISEENFRALRGKAFHDGATNAPRASGDDHA